MKKNMKKLTAIACSALMLTGAIVGLTACDAPADDDTSNTLFLYPINYYGIEGKAFTSRWDGMKAALVEQGWKITGDGQRDSKQFKAERTASCTMPEDTEVVFVNNQTWDSNLALTDKLIEYQPLAVISTCNGVEFCSEKISTYSAGTKNVTYASFSTAYEQAFKDGTLNYIASKYTASIAPIIGAIYSAVQTGERMVSTTGEPLHMEQDFWTITSYEEYMELKEYDVIDGQHPTIMKANMDDVLSKSTATARYEAMTKFVAEKTKTQASVKALYTANQNVTDTKATTEKFKLGLLIPNSVNDSIQLYIDFMSGYLADVYNYEVQLFKVDGSSTNQEAAAQNAVNAKCKAIISLQDDTDRSKACELASKNGVWFGVAGSCVYGTTEWEEMAACSYYVGSVGTSLDSEYKAGYDMVKYYIDIINERGAR